MDMHEKLAILQRDLSFLEEEHQNSRELMEAIHPDVSPILFMNQKIQVEELKLSIEQKKSDIKSLTGQMADEEFQ